VEDSAALTGELFAAIAASDVERVKRAIAAGASPDARQSYVVHEKFGDHFEVQETALDAALTGGREQVVIELIALGAEPTVSTLCRACSLGSQALVLRMLDAGADVNAMLGGASPLAQAAWGGHLALVHALIARGASLALQGASALSNAANAGRAEVVAALLALGVPADVPDAHGWTALMTAAWQDQPEVARLLLDAGANRDHRDARGRAAIDWARESRQRSVVALLEEWRR
jgi:ankyrin repeat protein